MKNNEIGGDCSTWPLKTPTTNNNSRRGFLAKAVMGGLAATFLPSTVSSVFAAPGDPTDLEILNYALTLEHLEHAFYRDQLTRFKKNQFARYSRYGSKTVKVYDLFIAIRDHEAAHVQTLTETIQSLGGTPVEELTYNFEIDNVGEFVTLAQTLENTGVMAYDGAIALIDSPALQTAGATIATVEARHAAFLNLINGTSPFPAAFDTTKTMDEILAAVQPFIVA